MSGEMREAVAQAIDAMVHDLECEGGIEDVAHQVFYSKYHFTREFTRITGTNPRRYLSALRMQRAKELLRDTDESITAITNLVGFSSVGTFSDRFRKMVGMSPSLWREAERGLDLHPIAGRGSAAYTGTVEISDELDIPGPLYVAAFPDSIVQGPPLAATVLNKPGSFRLQQVPSNACTVTVTCAAADERVERDLYGFVSMNGPHRVVQLRPIQATDPPRVLEAVS